MKKIKRKRKINLVNDINNENIDDASEWTGVNNTLQKQGSKSSIDEDKEAEPNERIIIDLTKIDLTNNPPRIGKVLDEDLPNVDVSDNDDEEPPKYVVPKEENRLTKNIGYLCNILQMIPISNMICKISMATGFTVMIMLNAEWMTLKWGFNLR